MHRVHSGPCWWVRYGSTSTRHGSSRYNTIAHSLSLRRILQWRLTAPWESTLRYENCSFNLTCHSTIHWPGQSGEHIGVTIRWFRDVRIATVVGQPNTAIQVSTSPKYSSVTVDKHLISFLVINQCCIRFILQVMLFDGHAVGVLQHFVLSMIAPTTEPWSVENLQAFLSYVAACQSVSSNKVELVM